MLTIALFTLVILCGAVGLKFVLIQLDRREDARFFWLISTFGPVLERAQSDPRVLLTWHPLAEISRKRFPDAFSLLDNGKHHHFPFSAAHVEQAHARWTAAWLTWEREHDAEFRQRGREVETKLAGDVETVTRRRRAELEHLEREKLERYQRHYEDYVQVSKAFSALAGALDDTAVNSDLRRPEALEE